MAGFGSAQGTGRLEDLRFLKGEGRYGDDIVPSGALHAVFLRSMVGHARIVSLDVTEAEGAPGVHLVLTADRLREAGVQLAMKTTPAKMRGGEMGATPVRPVLADGVVRFVGEPVAMIVAETLAQAHEAAELIAMETEDLPVAVGIGADPLVHESVAGNLAYDWAMGDEAAVADAMSSAAHRVSLDVVHNRILVNAMEGRAAFAEWQDGRLHFSFGGQGVWGQKDELARMLDLPADAIRVTNPDVGGGFGMKGMTYPEYIPLAQAARMLGRTVAWASERTEAMLSDNGGRGLVAKTELGFDQNMKIVAYRVDVECDLGAYNSQFAQNIQSELFAKVVTGCYDIQTLFMSSRGYFTNTTPVDAYRGAGRPEAIYTIERAMDNAARVLGTDPVDLRRRNFISAFPYAMVNGETVDVGDFARVMDRLTVEADLDGFAGRRRESEAGGRLRGLGLASYIEAILGAPNETARVRFDADGGVTLFVGTQSNGQGHETVYTQILADRTGIDPAQIRIVQGDSDAIPEGGGTGGSRSVTTQGTAMLGAVAGMVEQFAEFLGDELGPDVTFDDGRFGAPGSNLRLTMIEAAERARAAGRDDLLDISRTTRLDGRSFPNGAHLAEVEVDPDTGEITLERYTVTDDFGTLMNEDLVKGQVHGGVAQGFGQAVMENAVHDAQGQLLTASFMDYAMPRATDLPMVRFSTEPVPTRTNPLGMKGCGEAGTVGSLGAIANAVADALAQRGVVAVDMPFTPFRVWSWLKDAAA